MQDVSSGLPSEEDVRDALGRVLSSEAFAGADRLKEFLRYIVVESIEGRGDKILGKRIAQDVYGRRSEKDIASANVVRVDAGRLRRRLDAYYLKEGAQDSLRIHVAKGGYAPHFETNAPPANSQTEASSGPQIGMVVGAIVVLFVGFAAVFFGLRTDKKTQLSNFDPDQREQVERAVLFEASPAALQARNIAEDARSLLFPATQPARLLAALTLFEKAIELKPDYFGGYAGAAQAATFFGGLAPEGPDREQMLAQARHYAEEAMRLAPSEAWSQSAMATLLLFEREFDEANRFSVRAVELDPNDLIVLEFDAIIAFFSGDFERAVASSDPKIHENRQGSRFPWRNVLGNASYYLGNYEDSIDHLMEAAASGEPVSEINTAHLIASLQASGKTAEAQKRAQEYKKAWPDSRIEEFMFRLFRNPEDAENLMNQLRQAGWNP
ncbi:tetratricopeptide repeat protein [Ruegeria denitrificans]|uniref:tetratricopeptide repeat protein n=1 Tax=Ruegeria denitrificans TaxID=1715692 RepID=UPI003C79EE17